MIKLKQQKRNSKNICYYIFLWYSLQYNSPKGICFKEVEFILAGFLEISNEVFTHFFPTE